jgi:hypothetical protein
MRVTADPMDAHSDSDGLTDSQEVALRTNPEQKVTYSTTKNREEWLQHIYQQWQDASGEKKDRIKAAAQAMGLLENRTFDDLETVELTDGTDDFDFVRADDGSVTFLALDNQTRTDTWLSNQAELSHGTLAWDPDSDDDGLTDGQEVKWLTASYGDELWDIHQDDSVMVGDICEQAGCLQRTPTSPMKADTDGDGYWDGWIGVYGVGRSDNVVLYMEHLHDDDNGNGTPKDDGVQGNEIVQEQVKYHEISSSNPQIGADIDNDAAKEHSNLHIGELQFGTDPTDDSGQDVPDTTVTVEVDYYERANKSLQFPYRKQHVEQNYRLYGIDVELVHDEYVTEDELKNECYNHNSPIDWSSIVAIDQNFDTVASDHYLFVADRAANTSTPIDDRLFPNQTGVSTPFLNVMFVFTEPHQDELGRVPNRFGLSDRRKLQILTSKTAVHEIGHKLKLGEADESGLATEVYSGSANDTTREFITNPATGFNVSEWSVMSSGSNSQQYVEETGESYTAFSIEELMTINLPSMKEEDR